MTIQMIHFAEERPLETSTRLCIRQDLGMILSNFMGKREADDFELGRFKAFLACWKELDCGLIHVGRLEEISKTWFLECLFDETLVRVWEEAREAGIKDVIEILAKLKSETAFIYVAFSRKEALEAYQSYMHRLLTEQNPTEALQEVSTELEQLKWSLESCDPGITDKIQLSQVEIAESTYCIGKRAVLNLVPEPQKLGLIKEDLSKDFAQARKDYQKQVAALNHGARSNNIGFSAKRRPTGPQEPVKRPSTAPLPTTSTSLDVLMRAEDMPHL